MHAEGRGLPNGEMHAGAGPGSTAHANTHRMKTCSNVEMAPSRPVIVTFVMLQFMLSSDSCNVPRYNCQPRPPSARYVSFATPPTPTHRTSPTTPHQRLAVGYDPPNMRDLRTGGNCKAAAQAATAELLRRHVRALQGIRSPELVPVSRENQRSPASALPQPCTILHRRARDK